MNRSGGADLGYFTANETCRDRFFPRATFRDVAQSGSVSGLGPESRRFESSHPDQTER